MLKQRKIGWLLLLVLALRGLVPVGYMIDASADGLSIVLCDSGIYKDAVPVGADHHHHHGKDNSARHDHSICPFSLAAHSAPLAELPLIGDVVTATIDEFVPPTIPYAGLTGPSRAQRSRAPPHLS